MDGFFYVKLGEGKMSAENRGRGNQSRTPDHSVLFEKIVPGLLIFMGILMVVLILFAAGVLAGIIHF
jgi:hypothetical protein